MEQSQPPGRELEEEESEDAMDMERQQHTRGPDNTLINSSSRNRSSTSSSTSSCALQPLLSSSTPSTSHHKESSFDQLHSSPPLLSEISRRRGGVVLPSPPSPSPPPGQSTPSPFRRGISFGGATLHTTCTSEGSTREKNAKSNISSKVESENFADAHAAGGGGLPPFLAPANSFRRLAAAATTAKRWSTGGRHRAGAKGGRAGRRETAKSAPRLSSLEEVMNVKYEPPPDEEGVEAAATKAAARDGKRKGWKWLPRRAAFLVKALPKDVKRVGREGGREGCSTVELEINPLSSSLYLSFPQVHRRDQPRVLLLWYLLLVVFVSWCLFVLIKIVDDRNTPAQVYVFSPSLLPFFPSSLEPVPPSLPLILPPSLPFLILSPPGHPEGRRLPARFDRGPRGHISEARPAPVHHRLLPLLRGQSHVGPGESPAALLAVEGGGGG